MVFVSGYKPVGVCTDERMHGQKKLVGVAMGLYTGGSKTGGLANGIPLYFETVSPMTTGMQ